jgi:hypothetical protein
VHHGAVSAEPATSQPRKTRRLVARVVVIAVTAYLTLPPLLFVSWVAVANIVTLSWKGAVIWLPIALVGDALAVISVRRWRRDPGSGLHAVLPVLALAIALYVIVWLLLVLSTARP